MNDKVCFWVLPPARGKKSNSITPVHVRPTLDSQNVHKEKHKYLFISSRTKYFGSLYPSSRPVWPHCGCSLTVCSKMSHDSSSWQGCLLSAAGPRARRHHHHHPHHHHHHQSHRHHVKSSRQGCLVVLPLVLLDTLHWSSAAESTISQ